MSASGSGHHQVQQIGAPAASWPPQAAWLQRHRVRLVAALSLLIAVIAGPGVWRTVSGDEPRPNRLPFYLAVANLLWEPVAHYSGSVQGGAASWDLKTTSGGQALGTVTVAGQQISVMTVGGKTYVKPTQDMLAGLPAGLSASSVQGKWITGDDSLTRTLPQVLASRTALATALWKELNETTDFPKVGTGTVKVGADSALEVTTPDGGLYVSAARPYRVLRWVPKDPTGAGTGTQATGPSLTAGHTLVGFPHPVVEAAWVRPAAASGSASAGLAALGQTDFSSVSTAEADLTFSDLIAQTKTLNSAIDVGVRFDFNQTGNLNCSDGSCTVSENVVTSTTSTRNAALSGTATAVMTATVTVNGQAAGGCTQTQVLPVSGNGTIRCADSGVAPVVRQIKAQKQAQADQQARATGQSVRIPYTLDFEASVQIKAMADVQAKVNQEVGAEQAAQKIADQAAASCAQNSFVAGTEVLMADGTAEPIQDVKAGDTIENAAPGSKAVTQHTVAAVHITDNDRDFAALAIATPGGVEEIRSTAHHLFYDATTATWTTAAELKPGDRLQTADGRVATVRTVHTYAAANRTYNLTIDSLHTYYVEAGTTPVLVHNSGCDEWAAKFAAKNGGEIHTFDGGGAPSLGDYKLEPNESWGHHTVVVKDGRVFDQYTGSGGMPIDEWKLLWSERKYINFGF